MSAPPRAQHRRTPGFSTLERTPRPPEAYCIIHETDNSGADTVGYSAWSPTAHVVNRANSALVEFTVRGNATATVKVTNTFRGT